MTLSVHQTLYDPAEYDPAVCTQSVETGKTIRRAGLHIGCVDSCGTDLLECDCCQEVRCPGCDGGFTDRWPEDDRMLCAECEKELY